MLVKGASLLFSFRIEMRGDKYRGEDGGEDGTHPRQVFLRVVGFELVAELVALAVEDIPWWREERERQSMKGNNNEDVVLCCARAKQAGKQGRAGRECV